MREKAEQQRAGEDLEGREAELAVEQVGQRDAAEAEEAEQHVHGQEALPQRHVDEREHGGKAGQDEGVHVGVEAVGAVHGQRAGQAHVKGAVALEAPVGVQPGHVEQDDGHGQQQEPPTQRGAGATAAAGGLWWLSSVIRGGGDRRVGLRPSGERPLIRGGGRGCQQAAASCMNTPSHGCSRPVCHGGLAPPCRIGRTPAGSMGTAGQAGRGTPGRSWPGPPAAPALTQCEGDAMHRRRSRP